MTAHIRAARKSEWGRLLDYMSPSFFEVVSPADLSAQLAQLAASPLRVRRVRRARAARSASLDTARLGVALGSDRDGRSGLADGATRAGDAALRVFFHQVFCDGPMLLDLRRRAFTVRADDVAWDPASLTFEPSTEFRRALRDLYRGFYDDEPARFDRATATLGLAPARDLFRAHFGDGDQRAVRFSTAAFRDTFHSVFLRCREAGSRIHGEFVPLGVYLGCLYEHLDAAEQTFDVRRAYEEATA